MKGKGIQHTGHVKHEHKGHVMHHHGKKKGGGVEEGDDTAAKEKTPSETYAGAGSNVVKEAEARKKGGMCKKRGGSVDGMKAEKRLDRAPRKSGGRVGAEMKPLSAAHAVTNRPGGAMEPASMYEKRGGGVH